MKILAILFLIFAVYTYPKWSYKEFYKRGEDRANRGLTCRTCPERYSEDHCTMKCPS